MKSLTAPELKNSFVNAALYSLSSALYFVAARSIGTGLSMVIFYAYPVFIFLGLWVLRGQHVSRSSWISLFVVSFGFLLLNQNMPSVQTSFFGISTAIISCIFYAVYIVVSKDQAHSMNPYLATFVLSVISSLCFLVMTLMEGKFDWPHSYQTWLVIFALGFLATSAPVLLMLKGLKYVGADIAAILSILEPVLTLILGVLFLSEQISAVQILGIVVVLIGAIGATLGAKSTVTAPPVPKINSI